MARGMNKATLIGLVEREPEMRRTATGEAVSSLGVSTSRRWATSTGQPRVSTEWFQIVAWGKLADLACHKLRKGQRVYAEGHVQTRSWEADGRRHFLTEFVAGRLIPLSASSSESEGLGDETDEAAQCLNRIMVIGNLGRDPEMRYTPGGQAVTSFNLAATRSWTAANGERRDSTEWFHVVSWGSLAEICHQYLTKGRRVFVEGELRSRCWDQANGQKHFRTELVASEMIMLGPRPTAEANDESLA